MSDSKNLIIGLDGVPYELIKKYTDNGVMPFVKSIIDKGIFRAMNSSLPAVSSTAWTSFFTGQNPAVHNVYGFYDLSEDFQLKFNLYDANRGIPVWTKLKNENKRTMALNIPNTYPAPEINGVLISGFVAIDIEKAVYPRNLKTYLTDKGYILDVDYSRAAAEKEKFLVSLNKSLKIRREVFNELLMNNEWNLAIAVFTETDRMNHFLMNAFYEDDSEYSRIFADFYKYIDNCIEDLFGLFENKVENIIIISDHGFEKLETEFFLNYFLEEQKLLQFKSSEKIFPNISDKTICFACDPGRIYFNKKAGLSEKVKDEIKESIKYNLNKLRWNDRIVVKKIFEREEIYKGQFFENAPELLVLTENGIDIKGAPNRNTKFEKNAFTGMHTYENAIYIANSNKPDIPENMDISKVLSTINL